MAKINKGDLVEVTRSGQCWPHFEEKFRELGMINPEERRSSLTMGTQALVLNSAPRDGNELFVVILFESQEYLYGSTGLKIIESAQLQYEIY